MSWLDKIFGDAPVKLDLQHPGDFKRAYDLQRIGISGRPQHPDTDTASLFAWRRRNELVYACIEKIAQAALDPEIIVERLNSKGEWEEEPEHPLRRLLKRPNPLDDEGSFLGAWLASEHIAGSFYAEIVRSSMGLPIQLWPLDPCKVAPIAGKSKDNSPIVGYEFRDAGQRVTLDVKDVLHRQNPDLTNRFHGLSPLAVALGAVDSDTAQTDYVRSFFNNDGTPSGMLKTDQRIDQPTADAMEQRWYQKFARGGTKRKGLAVLGQGLDYVRTGAQLDELEADSLRGQSEARICMVFGVPPLLVGAYVGLLHVNQRASAREAQSDFWVNKMSPLFKRLRSFLTWRLLPEFESIELVQAGRVRVSWDMSQVIALQEDTDARHKRTEAGFKAGIITLNEARQAIGEEPEDGGDYYLRAANYSPTTGEAAQQIAAMPLVSTFLRDVAKVADADLDETVKAIDEDGRTLMVTIPAHLKGAPARKRFDFEGLTLTREPNAAERLAVKAVAQAQESGREKVKAVLLECRARLVTASVEALSKLKVSEYPSLTLEASEGERKRLLVELKGLFSTGVRQVRQEMGTGKAEPRSTLKALDEVSDELDDLTDATLSRVIGDVQSRAIGSATQLITLGVAAADFRERLKTALEGLSESPQEQAASGAANRALGMGRADEMEARPDEIGRYQYSAILDRNTCDSCQAEDGKEAGDPAELQSAPNSECEGLALCRCFVLAIGRES